MSRGLSRWRQKHNSGLLERQLGAGETESQEGRALPLIVYLKELTENKLFSFLFQVPK